MEALFSNIFKDSSKQPDRGSLAPHKKKFKDELKGRACETKGSFFQLFNTVVNFNPPLTSTD